jgi:hypothetical protein
MIRASTSARRRTDARSAALGFAAFVVLCGILLVALGGASEGEPSTAPMSEASIRTARDRTLAIERALAAGNYGDARDQAALLRDELERALHEPSDHANAARQHKRKRSNPVTKDEETENQR